MSYEKCRSTSFYLFGLLFLLFLAVTGPTFRFSKRFSPLSWESYKYARQRGMRGTLRGMRGMRGTLRGMRGISASHAKIRTNEIILMNLHLPFVRELWRTKRSATIWSLRTAGTARNRDKKIITKLTWIFSWKQRLRSLPKNWDCMV